jgi:hypothetical protein
MTARQEHFASLVARGVSGAAAYRQAYLARTNGRRQATEATEAYRLIRHPEVAQAIERERLREAEWRAEWGEMAYQRRGEALRVLERIHRGEIAAKYAANALTQLAECNRVRRQRTALMAVKGSATKHAWQLFLRAAQRIARTRPPALSAQERTQLIFARYAPVFPGGGAGAGFMAGVAAESVVPETDEARAHAAELEAHVRTQQEALRSSRGGVTEPTGSELEWGPLPGHFPPQMGWRRVWKR